MDAQEGIYVMFQKHVPMDQRERFGIRLFEQYDSDISDVAFSMGYLAAMFDADLISDDEHDRLYDLFADIPLKD